MNANCLTPKPLGVIYYHPVASLIRPRTGVELLVHA